MGQIRLHRFAPTAESTPLSMRNRLGIACVLQGRCGFSIKDSASASSNYIKILQESQGFLAKRAWTSLSHYLYKQVFLIYYRMILLRTLFLDHVYFPSRLFVLYTKP